MTINKEKIDLNVPAFGPGSQTLDDISDETKPDESEQKEEVEKEEEPAKEEESESAEEEEPKRVTYSRFKNVWSAKEEAERRAEEAQREADLWRERAEQNRTAEPKDRGDDMPAWFVKLYGDSPESQEAWRIQRDANERLRDEIRKEAIEESRKTLAEERRFEETREQENVQTIDSNFEQLEAYTGRELTEREQSAILDIVDEFTPKDEQGNYSGPLIPFERAWDYYEARQESQRASKTKSRDAVASITSSKSQGESDENTEKDKNFNPLDWSAWKKRI